MTLKIDQNEILLTSTREEEESDKTKTMTRPGANGVIEGVGVTDVTDGPGDRKCTMCSRLFWTCCSFKIYFLGIPQIIELQ